MKTRNQKIHHPDGPVELVLISIPCPCYFPEIQGVSGDCNATGKVVHHCLRWCPALLLGDTLAGPRSLKCPVDEDVSRFMAGLGMLFDVVHHNVAYLVQLNFKGDADVL